MSSDDPSASAPAPAPAGFSSPPPRRPPPPPPRRTATAASTGGGGGTAGTSTGISVGDVVFDLSKTVAVVVNHGYDKAQRAALTDDILIKVRDAAVKCNLDAKITKGLQVTTYNPEDLKNPSNFFNFVSSWEAIMLQIETHFKTFYMGSPFTLFILERDPVTEDDLQIYEWNLTKFLTDSAANSGDHLSYNDGTNDIFRPVEPKGALTLRNGGNILRDWHTMTLQQVIASVRAFLDHVDDGVDRQNLVWTFQYFMDCLDTDFKTFVLSKLSAIDPDVARSGPVVFFVIAQRLLQTTENLAQKVINGFIALRLTHFDGENVLEAIFVIRNVLKFLRFGEPNSFAPRTSIALIYDVFRGTTVAAYRAMVQQAQDIILKGVRDPEVLFDHFQSKYEELLLADRWVPTKKKGSAFAMRDDPSRTFVNSDFANNNSNGKGKQGSSNGNGNGKGNNPKPREKPVKDKSGRLIDYTVPKPGQSHTRERDGRTEHWCGKCGRWGSHLTEKHDEWKANFKARRNAKSNGQGQANAAASSNPNPGNNPRGSVTFLGALTGNTKLAVDPELTDGIDL